ncbi:hypothetical protein IP86_02990 [Rhodopseudomonas sp. AAP120]|uniref:phage capsid protein n=1 Tax=Rhodopseudomonas sp. AAP120 TaxID=1523430 RepID=UPI0006B9887A|nr:phage capsid protein [Rhodopseudomonas sp. AAP120]KPG01790.1 hypothetical protein IP86_02990 [Rhodopseudomonas sp. AAP120]
MGPITDEYKLTYAANVALVVQQTDSRFEDTFTYRPGLKGRQMQLLDLIGKTDIIVDGARGGDTPNIDNQTEPVWIRPRQTEWGKIIEKEDWIKALTDYQSEYVQSAGAAMKRGPDKAIYIPALFGPRVIGADGGATAAWAGSTVAKEVGSSDGATDTGMNVKKLVRGIRLLQAADVDIDTEQLFAPMNAQQIEDLYNDITYVNKDYRSKAVLEEKQVREILNVKIIPTENMPDYDSTHYTSALYCKSGMHWGEFSPLDINIGPAVGKKFRPQIYMERWLGATRSEDAKVVKIVTKK